MCAARGAFNVSGMEWELRESGPDDARHRVLLLPGGACSAAFYDELMAEPAVADVRFIAATLPGNAGTEAPADLSMRNLGRLAAELAAEKRCDVVLGFSMGSNVALEMALTAGFTGPLILTGVSFSTEAESSVLPVFDGLSKVLGSLPFTVMRLMFGPMLRQSRLPAARRAELLVEFKRNRPDAMRKAIHAYVLDLKRAPIIGERLRDVAAPVWIVHARKGDGRLTDVERQSLQQCPNVTIVTIPDDSFLLPNEHPAELAELIIKATAMV